MIELLRDIFTEGGLVAVIAVLAMITLSGLVYTVYILVKKDNKDVDVVLIQAEVIAQFGSRLEAVAKANAAATASLVQVAELVAANADRMDGLGKALQNAINQMEGVVSHRTHQIEDLPGRIAREMSPEFERLPQAIKESLRPQIEMLRQAIESLTQRIDDAADSIPAKSAEMTAEKLETLIEETLTKAVSETVKIITKSAPSPQGESERKEDNKPEEA